MKLSLLFPALALILTGCSSGSSGGSDKTPQTPETPPGSDVPSGYIGGVAEKGPFQETAVISIEEVGPQGATSNLQRFDFERLARYQANPNLAQSLLVTVEGPSISEIDIEAVQDARLQAFRVADLKSQDTNVNLLTHLHAQRTLALITDGFSHAQASNQALSDLATWMHWSSTPTTTALLKTTVSESESGSALTNEMNSSLFVLSSVLSARNALDSEIGTLSLDFADDGLINGAASSLYEALQADAVTLDLEVPMTNIRDLMGDSVNFQTLGNTLPLWVTGPLDTVDELFSTRENPNVSVEYYDANNGDLVLSGSDSEKLTRGDIFASDITPNLPYGALRRVVGVTKDNGQVLAVTEPVGLEDVIENGSIRIRLGDGETEAGQQNGAMVAASSAHSGSLNYRTRPRVNAAVFQPKAPMNAQSPRDFSYLKENLVPDGTFQQRFDDMAYCSDFEPTNNDPERDACRLRFQGDYPEATFAFLNDFGFKSGGTQAKSFIAALGNFALDLDLAFENRIPSGSLSTRVELEFQSGAGAQFDYEKTLKDTLACDLRSNPDMPFRAIGKPKRVWIGWLPVIIEPGIRCDASMELTARATGAASVVGTYKTVNEHSIAFSPSDGFKKQQTPSTKDSFHLQPEYLGEIEGTFNANLKVQGGVRLYGLAGFLMGGYADSNSVIRATKASTIPERFDTYDDIAYSGYTDVEAGLTGSLFFNTHTWADMLKKAGLNFTPQAFEGEMTKPLYSEVLQAASLYPRRFLDANIVGENLHIDLDWYPQLLPDRDDTNVRYEITLYPAPMGSGPTITHTLSMNEDVKPPYRFSTGYADGKIVSIDPTVEYVPCVKVLINDYSTGCDFVLYNRKRNVGGIQPGSANERAVIWSGFAREHNLPIPQGGYGKYGNWKAGVDWSNQSLDELPQAEYPSNVIDGTLDLSGNNLVDFAQLASLSDVRTLNLRNNPAETLNGLNMNIRNHADLRSMPNLNDVSMLRIKTRYGGLIYFDSDLEDKPGLVKIPFADERCRQYIDSQIVQPHASSLCHTYDPFPEGYLHISNQRPTMSYRYLYKWTDSDGNEQIGQESAVKAISDTNQLPISGLHPGAYNIGRFGNSSAAFFEVSKSGNYEIKACRTSNSAHLYIWSITPSKGRNGENQFMKIIVSAHSANLDHGSCDIKSVHFEKGFHGLALSVDPDSRNPSNISTHIPIYLRHEDDSGWSSFENLRTGFYQCPYQPGISEDSQHCIPENQRCETNPHLMKDDARCEPRGTAVSQ